MSAMKKIFNTFKGKPKKSKLNKNTIINNNNSEVGDNNTPARPKLTQEQIEEALLRRGPSKSGRYKVTKRKRNSLTAAKDDKLSQNNSNVTSVASSFENITAESGHEIADEIEDLARQLSLEE